MKERMIEKKRKREREKEKEIEIEIEKERERLRAQERAKKQELKAMIKEIQEEVQAKVTEQVVTMLKTFLGDVGLLLRHLLKGGKTSEPYDENMMGTARALQVLHQFDLEESESESESDNESDFDSDSEHSMNKRYSNACQCGKAVSQYQRGKVSIIIIEWLMECDV